MIPPGRTILLALTVAAAVALGGGARLSAAATNGAPTISPPGGVFTTGVVATITVATGEVRYTLDGSMPATNSPLYAQPVAVTNSCLLRARVFTNGQPAGDPVACAFTLLETNVVDFNSSLPLVVIETFGQAMQAESNTLVSLRCIEGATNARATLSGPAQFAGRAAVKFRGYTSRRYPKKSLAVELRDAADHEAESSLLGLPADSDWILYAPYPDKSLMRDVLAYDLSREMGHYASRTRFVEVFVNDSTSRLARAHYAGVYVLEEKVKRSDQRVKIQKLSSSDNGEPAITGGYIFKKDHLEEVTRDDPPPAATHVTSVATVSKPGRVGFPTGPGGFPAALAGFLPPYEHIVTLTNITYTTNVAQVTNTVATTNVMPLVAIVGATNIVLLTNIIPLASVMTATNVVIVRHVRPVTNVLALTNVTSLTNVASVTNTAPFPGVTSFTNVAVFTNLASFKNIAQVTNTVATTNLVTVTNLASVTNIASVTNLAWLTNTTYSVKVELVSSPGLATNVTVATSFTFLTNPPVTILVTTPTNETPKPPSVLTRLVESGQGFTTSRTNAFFYVEPKPSKITAEQRTWLSNHLNRFEQALHGADFRSATNGYAAFIDSDSFIDQHLLVEATKNIDGFRFSAFFTKDRGGRIRMEPIWDWNLSLGNASGRQGDSWEHWYWPQLDDRQYSWFRRLFDDPDFGQRYIDRWTTLRSGLLATSNLCARVDAMAATLKEPAARNFERWPILGTVVATEPFAARTYDEEITYLKGWASNRLAWIETQFLPAPRTLPSEPLLAPGGTLTFTSSVGRVFFTVDDTDPRLPGGAVSPGAKPFEQPLVVTNELRIFARTQRDNRWSGPLRTRVVVRATQTAKGG
jgi:hypothetical protein